MTTHNRSQFGQQPKPLLLLLIFSGLFGLVIQMFMADAEMLAFITALPALGGLVEAGRQFDEREQQLLSQAFSSAFQWMLLVLLIISAFYSGLAALHIPSELATFVSAHWTGLTVSGMCLLLGIVGFFTFRED